MTEYPHGNDKGEAVELAENEVLVRFMDEGPDSMGRRTFFAYWQDYVGPRLDEWGVRGQVFMTVPSEHQSRVEQRGKTVRYLSD